jgi:hypothetical protein
MKKIIPKILTLFFLILIIAQTGFFLFSSFLNTTKPASAENSTPHLQITIPNLKPFSPLTEEKDKDGNTIIKTTWIAEYIEGIYNYAIGIAGIVAATVLMYGGFSYLMSGGSPDKVSEAKSWIGASLSGLVLVMLSYTILNIVNPNLLSFGALGVRKTDPTAITAPVMSNSEACKNHMIAKNNKIDFTTAIASGGSLPINPNCNNPSYDFSGKGVDAKILKTIAMTESSCQPDAQSSKGACGIMQLMPDTAGKTCAELKADPQLSIDIAAQYIINNSSIHKNDRKKIYAGYNGGYAEKNANGTKGPLATSSDCSGSLAYECCINPGGLEETQDYVVTAEKYYKGMW